MRRILRSIPPLLELAVVLGFGYILLGAISAGFTQPEIFTGTNISFKKAVGALDINGANIRIMLSGTKEVLLEKDGEEPIRGIWREVSLGGPSEQYSVVDRRLIASGRWNVTKGYYIGVTLTSEAPMTVIVHKPIDEVAFLNFAALVITALCTLIVGTILNVLLHP